MILEYSVKGKQAMYLIMCFEPSESRMFHPLIARVHVMG